VHVVVVAGCSTPKKGSHERHPTHNLQLDGLAFKFNSADLEVNTNSTDITLGVRVVCKTEEETRLLNDTRSVEYLKLVAAVATYLSDTRVADEKKLEKIVVFASVHGELEYEMDGGY
jgi:hypothetical protein